LYAGVLADVSGKGAAAAIYAALTSGFVRSLVQEELSSFFLGKNGVSRYCVIGQTPREVNPAAPLPSYVADQHLRARLIRDGMAN
jgi:Stage II sporulation protein E (SpoIIE)